MDLFILTSLISSGQPAAPTPLHIKGYAFCSSSSSHGLRPSCNFEEVGASMTLHPPGDVGAAASVFFRDGAGTASDFGTLTLESNSRRSGEDQFYAIGFAEGFSTAERIGQQVRNLRGEVLRGLPELKPPSGLVNFLEENDKFIRSRIIADSKDPFWRAVGLIVAQFDGLLAGANAANEINKKQPLTLFDFQMLNGVGDIFDLLPATTPSLRKNFSAMGAEEIQSYALDSGHCSALIKVDGALSNIWFSHTSWYSYTSMIRMMKHYRTHVTDEGLPGETQTVSFSSYPGFLESLDDFYIMGEPQRLAMLQTTNNLFNTSLYDLVKPESVLAWMRVRTASLLAKSGAEWHEAMSRENSGTYENQYMVLDFKRFKPNTSLETGLLVVGEQIPGLYVYKDTTDELERGYWPSYNVPYHKEIYDRSGYPAAVKRGGQDLSYDLAPRAKIFRRDQAKVVDMNTFKRIMRYNDWENDPYSENNPCNTIACRGDLRKPGTAGGALDCKVSDYFMAMVQASEVVNGPTSTASSYGPGQPPFDWSQFPVTNKTLKEQYPLHEGQAQRFDFVFERNVPDWPVPKNKL